MITAAEQSPAEGNDAEPARFRRRLLDALAASIAEEGYANTTVADIVRRARTSRRTFYEHFSSKEDCFAVLHNDTNARMIHRIAAAVDGSAPWETQVRQAVAAWVAAADANPMLIVSLIREMPALGAAARRLQRDTMEHYIAMAQTLANTDELRSAGIGPISRQRVIMLFGGLRELTASTVENGGRISDIAEEFIDATLALIAPRP